MPKLTNTFKSPLLFKNINKGNWIICYHLSADYIASLLYSGERFRIISRGGRIIFQLPYVRGFAFKSPIVSRLTQINWKYFNKGGIGFFLSCLFVGFCGRIDCVSMAGLMDTDNSNQTPSRC